MFKQVILLNLQDKCFGPNLDTIKNNMKTSLEALNGTISKFRTSFKLKQKDIDYIHEKGLDTIRAHAADFIAKRESPAVIPNDGKQTPTKGHPVFVAQHATATCCRECIRKWHKMQPGKELSQIQQDYLVDVIVTWIEKELESNG